MRKGEGKRGERVKERDSMEGREKEYREEQREKGKEREKQKRKI